MTRRFLARLGAFASIQLAIGAMFMRFDPGTVAVEAFGAKVARLNATVGSPRLILVGGSNLPFGVDSAELSAAFPNFQITNAGCGAALGLEFMVNHVESLADRGDVILLAPEYSHFVHRCTGPLALDIVFSRPSTARFLSLADWKYLGDKSFGQMKYILQRIRTEMRGDHSRYTLKSFNDFGDITQHHGLPGAYANNVRKSVPGSLGWHVEPGILEYQIDRLNQLAMRLQARGVKVVLAYPPVAESAWKANQAIITEVRQSLASKLQVPILNSDMPPHWSDDLFFDTEWHLTGDGKQLRTAKLINSLKQDSLEFSSIRNVALPVAGQVNERPRF